MTAEERLESGRDAFRRQRWTEAYERLLEADREAPLGAEELEELAAAAKLCGRAAEAAEAWTRAHNEYLRRGRPGDTARAGRCAGWLAFRFFIAGEHARANGWLARAVRLFEGEPADCAERGYLALPQAMRGIIDGDVPAGRAGFRKAVELGERFGDRDLVAMGRMGEGRALVRLGEVAEGVALLDEIMVSIEAGEVSPILVGDLYCSVISACGEVFDLRRAQEWTAALSAWCEAQPHTEPHRGECLVRRAELLRLHGAWRDALDEAARACELAVEPPTRDPAVGAAFYQRAELHRLRGELDQAEADYRSASRWGRQPQPGLALLRLAQGQIDVARAAIGRATEEARDRVTRSAVLAAAVEIALAAGDLPGARAAADELACISAQLGAPYLRALSAGALGAVLVAEGQPRAALDALGESYRAWRELEAPYDAARVRVLVAEACRALGDEDSVALERDAARAVFERLGAAPDLARLQPVSPATSSGPAPVPGGLTQRELQVLRLIAAGATNRAVARSLFISEKTVARHVSHIFEKLGVSTRAAATAYAYRHGIMAQEA